MIGISVAANKERNYVREYFKDSINSTRMLEDHWLSLLMVRSYFHAAFTGLPANIPGENHIRAAVVGPLMHNRVIFKSFHA